MPFSRILSMAIMCAVTWRTSAASAVESAIDAIGTLELHEQVGQSFLPRRELAGGGGAASDNEGGDGDAMIALPIMFGAFLIIGNCFALVRYCLFSTPGQSYVKAQNAKSSTNEFPGKISAKEIEGLWCGCLWCCPACLMNTSVGDDAYKTNCCCGPWCCCGAVMVRTLTAKSNDFASLAVGECAEDGDKYSSSSRVTYRSDKPHKLGCAFKCCGGSKHTTAPTEAPIGHQMEQSE
jgi:hypothetical protein